MISIIYRRYCMKGAVKAVLLTHLMHPLYTLHKTVFIGWSMFRQRMILLFFFLCLETKKEAKKIQEKRYRLQQLFQACASPRCKCVVFYFLTLSDFISSLQNNSLSSVSFVRRSQSVYWAFFLCRFSISQLNFKILLILSSCKSWFWQSSLQ